MTVLRSNLWNVLVLSFVLLVAHSAPAQFVPSDNTDVVLDPVELKAQLFTDGSAELVMDAVATNTGISVLDSITIRVDSLEAIMLSSTIDGVTVPGTVARLDRFSHVVLPLPDGLHSNESVSLHLVLRVTDLQSSPVLSSDGLHQQSDFILYVRPVCVMQNFTFVVHLPPHASLSQESVVPLFPDASGNLTDGHSMIFYWWTTQLQPGQERVFIVKYQIPAASVAANGPSLFELILAGLVGLVLGALLFKVMPLVILMVRRLRSVRIVGVTGEEQKVLDAIRDKGGSCPQKDLYVDLNMSQAKVSIILGNLEERGLVRRFKDGRENMVHLMEE
ncbi:MAG: MarR family transcriptional regulator [Candidatus Thorarchaeota archaeon]|nr:MarR family transcriptional regulator [Candidatus Thorarchaeota archaeon]